MAKSRGSDVSADQRGRRGRGARCPLAATTGALAGAGSGGGLSPLTGSAGSGAAATLGPASGVRATTRSPSSQSSSVPTSTP